MVAESPIASLHVDQLRAFERRLPAVGPDVRAPILERGEATGFVRVERGLAPQLAGATRVELAAKANGEHLVHDPVTQASLRFSLVDASAASAQVAQGMVLYRGAVFGADLVQRPTDGGTEDYVFFTERPAREALRYRVNVASFAGLRLVGNVLELVDAKGLPRARVALPWVYDKTGDRHEAQISVEGCNYNGDGSSDATYKVVPPGSAECDVVVAWDQQHLVNCEGACKGLEYPLVVDPLWTTATTKMIGRRKNFGFDVFQFIDAVIYVAGGDDGVNYLQSVETCVISGSSCVFSSRPAMAVKRGEYPTLSIVQNVGNRLLVAGGRDGSIAAPGLSLSTAEFFDGAAWSAVAPMAVPRRMAGAAWTSTNEILIAGGFPATSNVQIFNPTSRAWTTKNAMGSARWGHTLTALPNGDIVAAGGNNGAAVVSSVEAFRPSTGNWTPLAAMASPRLRHAAVVVGSELLIAGGNNGTTAVASATTYNWSTGVLTATGSMTTARELFSLAAFGNRALAAGGGAIGSTYSSTAEIYDSATRAFVAAGTMPSGARGHHAAATASTNTEIVIVGGTPSNTGTPLDATDVFTPLAEGEACTDGRLCRSQACVDGVCCGSASCAGGGKCNNPGALGRCTKTNGLACAGTIECLTGFCVDGVCCNSACNLSCEACSAAKSGGANGTCTKVPAGADPDNNCPAQSTASCGNLGGCDGAGGCRKHPSTTVCVAASCPTATTYRPADRCSGSGSCVDGGADVNCAPGRCVATTGCVSTCTSDAQCAPGGYCDGATCRTDLVLGGACARNEQCQSGFCVDGVCCESACTTGCYACRSDLKADKSANGLCRHAVAGSDPRGNCTVLKQPQSSCGLDGTCNGTGACRNWVPGTGCGSGVCKVGNIFAGRVCNGAGTCGATGTETACGAHVCRDATGCAKPCASEADCTAGNYCDLVDGLCKMKTTNGGACASPSACASGICVGASTGVPGVCCNTPCMGQCESCTTEVAKGTCVPVLGDPPMGKMACDAGSSTDPCSARRCDGKDGTTCAGYVSGGKCSEASCTSGSATSEGKCNAGKCEAPSAVPCGAFACSGTACATRCTTDTECAPKFRCDTTTSDCVPRETTSCKDPTTELAPDGRTEKSCAPYKCAGNACLENCDGSDQCSAGFVCDTASRTCTPAPSSSEDDGGCGCRTSPSRSASPWLLALVLAAAARLRRTRSLRR